MEVFQGATMAGWTTAIARSTGYVGLTNVFEYVNGDGVYTKWNCGQAAAATLLAHHGCDRPQLMLAIERRFPPDILGGWLGSSRRLVRTILKSFQLDIEDVRGETALRDRLTRGIPVIVMLGVSGGRCFGMEVPSGHWMVAYGCDDDAVYLTNWNAPMPWEEFRKRWRSVISRMIQMSDRGLAASPIESEGPPRSPLGSGNRG